MPELAEKLETAGAQVQFDEGDFARALGTTSRTVARWLHGQSTPRPDTRERLLKLVYVFGQLSKVLQPAAARDWLLTPNSMLEHEKPIELLRKGEHRRVLGAIETLAEGAFV